MARIRTIKPEFCTSEQIVECSTSARLLFVTMWCFCDDNGIHPDSTGRLKMECFPADACSRDDIGRWVDELIGAGLLIRYEAHGCSWLAVTGWHKHQKIDRPSPKHPTPDGSDPSAYFRHACGNSTSDRRGLDERSPPEGKGREGKGRESKAAPPTPPPTDTPAAADAGAAWAKVGRAVVCALGWDQSPTPRPYGVVRQWLADGADPERDIMPAIQAAMADGRAAKARGLAYFWPAIEERMRQRLAVAGDDALAGEDPRQEAWRVRLEGYRDRKFWAEAWGAKPRERPRHGQLPCQAPADLVEEILGIAMEMA